jgi:precorrin-8X/cobalt-precorrin-8 methylmutase
MTAPLDYEHDPAQIYRQSFSTIWSEADLSGMPVDVADIVVRVIHACGMTDIVADLAFTNDVAESARHALENGAPVLVDVEMVRQGIIRDRLPMNNKVVCTLNDSPVAAMAKERQTTRSAAAVELWRPRLHGAVIAIGNAPTALFRLLELIEEEGARPAALFAFPVGFVGAAESKDALADGSYKVPYLTLRGRRGGSAMAAAAVNALGGDRDDR